MRGATQFGCFLLLTNPRNQNIVLGKAFFRLAQDLEAANTFEVVADLLCTATPRLLDAAAAVVIETCCGKTVRQVYGDCDTAHLLRERLDAVNRLLPSHPLMSRFDLRAPGELGVAASDFLTPEEYSNCEFSRLVHRDQPMEDAIVGKLVVCCERTTVLGVCRSEGVFTPEQREIFDAILFTARAVLGRIGSAGVEASVRNFLLTAAGSPVGFFVIRADAEVLPLSHEAVHLSEQWWAEDEATREVDADTHESLRESLRGAWLDPVTAAFHETELDLGGGMMECHALPKANGEILVFMPASGHLPSGDEALKAVLTKRQREIMEWIAEGKTSAETAIILDISPRTVEKHLEAVFQRLGVENRISAVRRFLDLKSGHAT